MCACYVDILFVSDQDFMLLSKNVWDCPVMSLSWSVLGLESGPGLELVGMGVGLVLWLGLGLGICVLGHPRTLRNSLAN